MNGPWPNGSPPLDGARPMTVRDLHGVVNTRVHNAVIVRQPRNPFGIGLPCGASLDEELEWY